MKNRKNTSIKIVKMTGIDGHIQTALKSKSGIETLEKLLELKNKQEDREASKLFHEKFCEMQSEFPPIKKTKSVKDRSGKVLYKYAPLEQIRIQILPALKKYGFSYNWTEEFPNDKSKKIHFHLTGYGHTETCSIVLPIQSPNAMSNSIQQSGSTSTYGKRYTLIGMLGLTADEDVDGKLPDQKSETKTDNKWGDAETKVWKKIGEASDILGKTQVQLKNEFKIKNFKEFNLKALNDFLKVLNGQIDLMEKNNE